MAENPRFNNSDMFKGVSSNDYSDITPDSTSEVLATQGNVINSIKVFWNKLKAKLAYAVTRSNTNDAVGGKYQPVYVNDSGDVTPCSPSVFQTVVNNSTINLPEDFPLYAGQTVCFNVTSGSGNNSGNLKIGNISVCYPTGAAVKGTDVIGGSYLFTYIPGNGDKWILNNKINVVSSAHAGLMTIKEHNKLEGIAENANNFTYTLPTANADDLGGVKSSNNNTDDNNRKVYHVGVDNNGIMTVNVPWQNTHNIASIAITTDKQDSPNITLTNSDGSGSSSIPVVGLGGTQVARGKEGQLVIDTLAGSTYDALSSSNGYDDVSYTVKGPGRKNIDNGYVLRGDGTWSSVIAPMKVTYNNLSFSNGSFSGEIGIGYDVVGYNTEVQQFIWVFNKQIVGVGSKLRASSLSLSVGTGSFTVYFIPILQKYPRFGILSSGKLITTANSTTGSVSTILEYS